MAKLGRSTASEDRIFPFGARPVNPSPIGRRWVGEKSKRGCILVPIRKVRMGKLRS
jgi:hypothetical protein